MISGVPDCHFVWRGFNEVALNPFFMLGDKQKLLDVIERNPYYKQLRFNPKYFDALKYDWDVQFKRVGLEYEPFYCLFWAVLEAGQKLNYPSDNYGFANRDNKLPATRSASTPAPRYSF